MAFKKKQYLMIFIILFAVIGIVGAGCLGNNNDNNTTNNTTNNSTNTSNNTSNNTTNTSNNTSSNNTTNKSTDVIYANQSSGGGGGSRGSSSQTPAASLNGNPVVVDPIADSDDPNVKKVYVYVPSTEISAGTPLTLTMLGTVTDVDVLSTSLINESNTTFSGKTVKVEFLTGSTTSWETPDLNVTVGGIVYQVSFYASAAWKASAGPGGSLKLIEIAEGGDTRVYTEGVVNAGSSKNFVTEQKRILFTLVPVSGNVGTLTVNTSADVAVPLTQTGPNTYETQAAVTAQTYTVNATFEKKAVATDEDGNKLVVDQNLGADRNIYIYVPSSEIGGKEIKVDIGKSVCGTEVLNSGAVASSTPSGNTVTIEMQSSISGLQQGGIASPSTVTVNVTAADGTVYNIYVLESAVLKITVPAGITLTSVQGLDLQQGTYYFVADLNSRDTFTASSGTVYIDGSSATGEYTFSASKTYVLTIVS